MRRPALLIATCLALAPGLLFANSLAAAAPASAIVRAEDPPVETLEGPPPEEAAVGEAPVETLDEPEPELEPIDTTPPAPTITPLAPLPDEDFTLVGSTLTSGVRPIEFQYLSGSTWKKVATASTKADGSYSFVKSTDQTSRSFRVIAPVTATLPASTSETLVVNTVPDKASLSIVRNGSTAVATATMSPVRTGRSVYLQYSKSGEWTRIGSKVAQTADGKATFSFSLSGLSQYSTRSYRIYESSFNGSTSAKSPTIKFMPGPSQLGTHVLRIQTPNNVAIDTKSKNYPGTLAIDGGPALALTEVGVHGNSTANYAKKPYKVKFEKDVALLGIKKAKNFNLLASYNDRSLIREKMGLDLGLIATDLRWAPANRYAEVFVNDEYKGSYLVTESIKIAGSRVNVDKEKGMIIEVDPLYKSEGLYGFTSKRNIPITIKDPDEVKLLPDNPAEGYTPEKLAALKKRVDDLETVLYGSSSVRNDPVDGYAKYLDVASAVDFHLVKEFTKDADADFDRSIYFSWKDYTDPTAKFFMGPVWDFDRSAGIKYSFAPDLASPKGWWMHGTGSDFHTNHKTHWYVQLLKDPAFRQAVSDRWQVLKPQFKAIGDSKAQDAANQLGVAAGNDWNRWLGIERHSFNNHATTYQGEITWVAKWYQDRYKWMDAELTP